MTSKFFIIISLILAASCIDSKATDVNAQTIRLESIKIRDISGKSIVFAEKKLKVYVFAFISSECPVSNKYIPRLNTLFSEFKQKGTQLIAINANPENSIQDIQKHAREYKVEFPVVHDMDQKLMSKFKVKTTSEVIAISSAGVIFYRGAIDDQFSVGSSKLKAKNNYLRDAINKFLDDGQASPSTPASGCIISKARTS